MLCLGVASMRPLYVGLLWLVWTAGSSAADLDEFLRVREPEAQPVRRTAIDLSGRETCRGGMHTGHQVLNARLPRLTVGRVPYGLGYNLCFDRQAHPRMRQCWPREGYSGLGLEAPTGCNFYGGGFLDVLLDGASVGPYLASVEHRVFEGRESLVFSWELPAGKVALTFSVQAGDDRLLVTGHLEPANRRARAQVRLNCFPSGFREPRDRWITTAYRELRHRATVTLQPEEYWVLFWDKILDEALRPKESAGPAGLMFSPTEVRRAKVKVGDYAITAELNLAPYCRDFHLALWEFKDTPNTRALARLQEVTRDLTVAETSIKVAAGPPRMLAKGGQATATIILPKVPRSGEQLAAQELQDYLYAISDALLPIRRGEVRTEGNRLLIGRTAQGVATRDLGREGFVLSTRGRDIIVAGGGDAGTLYAAYELLERLGCRWVMPGPLGEVIPRKETVRLPELDVTERPDFPMRWVGHGLWSLRNKGNHADEGYPRFNVQPGIYHSQYRLLPHKELFPKHPEYFALYKGQRLDHPDAKPCTSNPEVVKVVAANMAKMLDADPSIDLISLSPTDGSYYCECPNCTALDEPDCPHDQKMSRRMLMFYNAVARELARTHPKVKILAGAYHVYNRPPKDQSLKADPHLAVVICHYTDYCSMHAIDDETCPRNVEYRRLLEAWQNLIPDVYFYEYYHTDGFRQMPCNLVHAIRRDIPFFHRQGYKGLYTQYGSQWTTFLNYYIAARLLWDVDTDVDAVLDDLYGKFFRRAAAPMKAYFTAVDQALEQTELHLCTCSLVGHDPRKLFPPELRARFRAWVAEAQQLAQEDLVKRRVAKVAASVEYVDRYCDYLNWREKATQATDAAERRTAAAKALALIEGLHEEVQSDREKWGDVVSPASYHWRYDLRAMRKWAARSNALPGKKLAELPAVWRFSLDRENVGEQQEWFQPGLDDGSWAEIRVGKHWEDQGYADYDGYAWYRTTFVVTPEQAQQRLGLYFGGVDATAWVYWNGKLLGRHEGWDEPFHLALPPREIRTDEPNSIAVRVFDTAAKGGIYAPVLLLRLDR